MIKIRERMKRYLNLSIANGVLWWLFLLAGANFLNYLLRQAENPFFWPWLTWTWDMPDFFVSHPPLIAWLFFMIIGILLFVYGLLQGNDADYNQSWLLRGCRWVGLAIVWQMLMFSVPIDVLKFIHSFNF